MKSNFTNIAWSTEEENQRKYDIIRELTENLRKKKYLAKSIFRVQKIRKKLYSWVSF